jgi:Zn-dependent peptidase ImmA (M78 family)
LLAFVSSAAFDRSILHRSANTSPTKPPAERFADAFALDLLIPEEGLKQAASFVHRLVNATDRSIGDVELLYLARIFGVTFFAIAKRCERARMLPRGSAVTFDRFLTVKFGGADRRAQLLDLPPRPETQIPSVPTPLQSIIKALVEDGHTSTEQALAALLRSPNVLTLVPKVAPA